MLSTVEPLGSFAFCDGCAASSSEGEGTLGTSLNLGKRMRPRRSLTLFLLGGNLSVLQELECRPTSWADSRFAGSRITEDFNEVIGDNIASPRVIGRHGPLPQQGKSPKFSRGCSPRRRS